MMYNPEDMNKLLSMFELFPAEMMKALGFAEVFTDMTGYLASWLYGLLMIGFPMVYSIILGNRLIAKTVDSGSIACLLTTTKSRVVIIVTKWIYGYGSIIILFGLLFICNVGFCLLTYPDYFNIGAFFRLNITIVLVNLLVLSIVLFFSSVFNETKFSLAFGAGIPITFLLINMLAGGNSNLEFLKYFSIFGWYSPLAIINGESYLLVNCIYLILIVLLTVFGILIFRNKRLPI